MKRLLRAAEQGDPNVQFNVGVVYDNGVDDNGNGIERNRGEAIKWLLKAAQQGLPRAQSRLAEIYAEMSEVPGNSVNACAWFLVATTNLSGVHRHTAQTGFERICTHMTRAEIAKAHHFAAIWGPKKQDDSLSMMRRKA